MTKEKIARINELAHASKERELTPEEKAEQKVLRLEYINDMKQSLIGQLENTEVLYPDGHKEKLAEVVKGKQS